MIRSSPQRQLLIRGFGYGVFITESVPPELNSGAKRKSNGDLKKIASALRKRLEKNGLEPVQEILPDPEDPNRAVVILGRGQEPCDLELNQFREYMDRLRVIAEINPNSRLSERLQMLEAAESE